MRALLLVRSDRGSCCSIAKDLVKVVGCHRLSVMFNRLESRCLFRLIERGDSGYLFSLDWQLFFVKVNRDEALHIPSIVHTVFVMLRLRVLSPATHRLLDSILEAMYTKRRAEITHRGERFLSKSLNSRGSAMAYFLHLLIHC